MRRELHVDGRLLATHTDGRSHLDAYLDDHTLLIDAVLELQQLRWNGEELAFAISLAEALLARFEDRERGGCYFTSHDHEELIVRTRSFGDEATPSGNGIAAQVLQRLGRLLAEPRYLDAAERTPRAETSVMARYPHGHASMLAALEDFLDPLLVIVLRGPAAGIEAWRAALARHYDPRRLVIAIPAGIEALPAALADNAAGKAPLANVCRGLSCGEPLTTLDALLA